MFRQNQLCGCAALAFGIGLLIGLWVESAFWGHCFSIGIILFGGNILFKK